MIRFFSTIAIIISIFFLVLSFKPTPPPAVTEGFITYSIDINSDQAAAELLAVGSSLEIAFKGNYMRAVARAAAGSSVTIVADSKNQTGITLMDVLGEKKAVKLPKDRFEKAKADISKLSDNPTRVTDETKTIAGYTCKKVLMKHKESGANMILYITDEINPKDDPFAQLLMAEIKGFPLGIVIRKDETTVKIMADKVSSKGPSSSLFSMSIPSDYTVTTFEELEKTAKSKMEKK